MSHKEDKSQESYKNLKVIAKRGITVMSKETTSLVITQAHRDHFAKVLNKKFISDKVIRTLLLVNNGVDIAQAIFLSTGNTKPSADTVCRIKRESEITLSVSKSLDLLATSTWEKAMTGQAIVSEYVEGQDAQGVDIVKKHVMLPKFQHALSAADSVKARTEPIKSNEPQGDTFNFVQINASEFRSDSEPQDMVLEHNDNNVLE